MAAARLDTCATASDEGAEGVDRAHKFHGVECDHSDEGPNVTVKSRWRQGDLKEPCMHATKGDSGW